MWVQFIFVWKDDSHAINGFISKLIWRINQHDDAKIVDSFYVLESELSGLVQKSICYSPEEIEEKHKKKSQEINISRKYKKFSRITNYKLTDNYPVREVF